MAISTNFHNIIDLPEWRPIANAIVATTAGTSLAWDPREFSRSPYVFMLGATTGFYAYHTMNDEWFQLPSPALSAVAAGSCTVFHPQGPSGSINAVGATTTSFALTTALPATVQTNQLANRGDGKGFTVRVIGKTAGKTEQVRVVGNTSGTTPTLTVSPALSFTPAAGDLYEFKSGRVYLLGSGVIGTSSFKYYDILTNSFSAGLATTNLPATIATDSCMLALGEDFTPYNLDGSSGMVGQITATASSATTITGSVAGPDSGVFANEYRNFQIRIVQDLTTPAAVGQRARITSHTAGASPVYTVPTWATTPSASAVFVIENDNDKILLWSSAVTTTFNYNIAANTWDTTTWSARGNAVGAGCTMNQGYGIQRDTSGLARQSYCYATRGGASAAIDMLDIAGGATGLWTNAITYGLSGAGTYSAGTCSAYDPNTNQGRYIYFNNNGGQHQYRFDVLCRVIEPWRTMQYSQSTAAVSERMAMVLYLDDDTSPTTQKLQYLMLQRMSGTEGFQCLIQR
jgi:hypothetical protein